MPENIDEIRAALQKERKDSPGIKAYHRHLQLAFAPMNEEATRTKIFDPYLGTSADLDVDVKPGHWNEPGVEWTSRVQLKDSEGEEYAPKPTPDYAEGIKRSLIDRRVCKSHPSILVSTSMALPNFMVELKHHQSMFTAHTQNRYSGAIAARAWYEYDKKLYGPPSRKTLDVARVGTMEFNGDVMVGNVHWLSRHRDGIELPEPEYHMTRVMNHFVFGLSYDDYKLAHKEASNFRDYFFERRDEVIEELQKKQRGKLAQRVEEEEQRTRTQTEIPETQSSTPSVMVQVQIGPSADRTRSVGRTRSQRTDSTTRGKSVSAKGP